MEKPNLIDPRTLYTDGPFPEQEQDTPAIQDDMRPEPDCGEKSYQGNNRLKHRNLSSQVEIPVSDVQQPLPMREKVPMWRFNSFLARKKMPKKSKL